MSVNFPCVHHRNGLCYLNLKRPELCTFGQCDNETPSNADKIRAMNDYELFELLNRVYCAGTLAADRRDDFRWNVEWLQQPAKEDI